MTQLIPGWIRQLTTRKEGTRLSDLTDLRGKEGTGKFEVHGIKTGRVPSESQKQLNIRIQSAAADIVTWLITADIILSQRAKAVEEIVSDMLWRAFEGATLAAEGWEQQVVKTSLECVDCGLKCNSAEAQIRRGRLGCPSCGGGLIG